MLIIGLQAPASSAQEFEFVNNFLQNLSFITGTDRGMEQNLDDNLGWIAGFSYGNRDKPGSSAFRYNYRHIEKDVVIAAFTDSDFMGGGTDGKGHEFNLSYQVAKKVMFEATYYFCYKELDKNVKYHKVLLDLNFKI